MNFVYIDGDGGMLGRRSNWSRQKETILNTLLSLESSNVAPTALDDQLEVKFFDVPMIARHIFGDPVFTEGRLDRGKRSSLNKSLDALHWDGFVDKRGARYRASGRRCAMRDFYKNSWSLTHLGRNRASSGENRASRCWREENRFYGIRGIKVDRSQVERIAASEYWADLD